MKSLVKNLTVLLLGSCLLGACTKRTVLSTERRVSFGDAWGSQVGDQDKIKKKFASGFKIEDGQAVAAETAEGGTPITGFEGKEFDVHSFSGGKKFGESGKENEMGSKMFRSINPFATKEYAGVKSARENSAPQLFADEESSSRFSSKSYRTRESGLGDKEFATKTSPDSGRLFPLENGGKARESRAPLVDAEVTHSMDWQNPQKGLKTRSSMSEDEVRRLLHPELYR